MIEFTKNEQLKSFLYLHTEFRNQKEANDVIGTLEAFRNDWGNLRNQWFERTFPLVYITYGRAWMFLQNYDKAIEILNEGKTELEHKDFEYFFKEKAILYDLLSQCYIHKKLEEEAYKAMLISVFNDLYAINNTHSNQFEFYSFRNFNDFSLSDIENETISLCSPQNFNDPVDTAFNAWMHYKYEVASEGFERNYIEIQCKAYNNIRVRCLVRNIPLPYKEGKDYPIQLDFQKEYANSVMWAHYANNHQGFCVKFKIPSLFTMIEPNEGKVIMLMPINYTERLSIINFGNSISNISFKEAFLTKQKNWEYEHEHRILYYNKNGSEDFPSLPLPKGSIVAIYLGVRCSDDNKQKIFNLIKNKSNVEVYQMQISSEDIYKLKSLRVDGK